LFRFGHRLEPLDTADVPDMVEPGAGRVSYRFFRDSELVPFAWHAREFRTVNAWCLAEASLLAYAGTTFEPQTEAESAEAAASVSRVITPSLERLFRADGSEGVSGSARAVHVHTVVRSCPLSDVADPVQCYVADDGEVGIVVFRGTVPSSLANWLTDCNIEMVNASPRKSHVLVHGGFLSAVNALLNDWGALAGLRSYLTARRREAPGLRLWFAGHSLGGALATLAAHELGAEALYTYGSPRVGNVHFANAFSQARLLHYRVVHRDDIVACVPFPLPLFEYEHVGELKYIEAATGPLVAATDETEPRADDAAGAIAASALATPSAQRFWDRLRDSAAHLKLGRFSGWLEHIVDHAPLLYTSVLWNALVAESAGASEADHHT
jgi:hypothetical protein